VAHHDAHEPRTREEITMKKTRIPDFSAKPKGVPAATGKGKDKAPAPPRTGAVKPQATSAKSGRRGS
jgi:hypothetical protein